MRYFLLASLLLLTKPVFAESVFEKLDKYYFGGGAGLVDANIIDNNRNSVTFNTMELIAGYKHNGYLGADLRIGFGMTNEDVDFGAGLLEAELENYYALYWRTETANETAKLYGLLGYGSVSMAVGDASNSDSGLSYGAGFGFAMFDNWNLNFEYRTILNNDDNEFTIIGAYVDRRF